MEYRLNEYDFYNSLEEEAREAEEEERIIGICEGEIVYEIA